MNEKLKSIESKIIVGGVNLLEKAEKQAKLLEESDKQLEKQKEKRAAIQQQLQEKEVRLDEETIFLNKFSNIKLVGRCF